MASKETVYKVAKEKETIYKVAISIPNEGVTLPESYDNHLVNSFRLGFKQAQWKYEKRNPRYEFYWHTAARLLTPLAREKLLHGALEGGMDYIIMYDDDMVLPVDMIEKLLMDMEKHPEIDILAPLAFMRQEPHFPVMYTSVEGYDPVRRQAYFTNQAVKNHPRDQLVECDAVGFGAVCIKTEILKRMNVPYCFSTDGSGEDIWFCYKARREANARVFMDTRIKLGHLGNPIIIDEAYYEKYVKENKIELPDTQHKYLRYTQ